MLYSFQALELNCISSFSFIIHIDFHAAFAAISPKDIYHITSSPLGILSILSSRAHSLGIPTLPGGFPHPKGQYRGKKRIMSKS